ncbi:MAG: hypothetical protein WBL27_05955 [Salinimicrobium sp.]
MKSRGRLIGILFIFIVLSACSLEALRDNLIVTGESGYNYTESRKQWLRLRNENKNTYKYSILELFVTNHGNETFITVERGKVTGRDYEAFMISEEDGSRIMLSSYSEREKDIGTHAEGALPVSIDDLYDTCLADYLSIDPDSNTVYFDTDDTGVISLCGFVPDLCQDDCFVGFELSSFSWNIK